MRKIMLSGVALAALAPATPAFAQDADQATDNGGIQTIVVTAQRKEETLQKAGIAIDAVTGADLTQAGIQKAEDITKSVPAITITNGGGSNTSIFLRGVGNVTNSSYNDPAVTPSYDGVVLGRAAGAFGAAFYDLARVEVLKGPQGILYGRNATGGAVNILPNRPKLGQTGAGFNVSYGNYNAFNIDGYLNVATSDNSALRIAGTHQGHDAYNRDGTDDLDRNGLRAQFLIEPSSDVSLRIGADWTKVGGKGPGGSYIGAFVPGPAGYTLVPSGLDNYEGFNTTAANTFRQSALGAPGFAFLNPLNQAESVDYTYWGVNAELTVKTGIGTVTVIPAYRDSDGQSYFYGPAFNTAYNKEHDKQTSLEARLAGSTGPVDYVVGGFYFHETIDANNEYNQEFVLPIQSYHHKTDSWAAFGQLTAHVTDQFRLIGGARYTHDYKSMNGIINNFIAFCGGIPPVTPPASFNVVAPPGCATPGIMPHFPNFLNTGDTVNWLVQNGYIPANSTDQPNTQVFPISTAGVPNGYGLILKTYSPVIDSGTYSRVTWKVGAEYDVGPENLLYATVESGYRAGGFQLAEGHPSYKPEFITAYTFGSKNRFLNNKLQVNLETFLWKYRDQQITYFTVDSSGTLINSNENAGKATIYGFDLDILAKPTRNTTLGAKVQYLHTKYDDLHLYTAPPRNNINCPVTPTGSVLNDGVTPVLDFNCSGKPLLFSPRWTVNLSAEQVIPLTDRFDLVANVATAWRDDQYGAFEFLDFEHIPAYWTTDAGLTFRDNDHGWSLSGFVRNIEDKRRIAVPQSSPIGFAVARYTAPRTYGIRFSGDF